MTLTLQNAFFAYPKSPLLLKDISLSVQKGEIIAILGPNGAGKTTLLKCLLGLLPLARGQCLLNGKPVAGYGRALWKQVGYVPQARSYTSAFAVEDMVLMGRNAHVGLASQPTAEDMQLVRSKLAYLGISHLWGKQCNRLSGGELQMVLLARTLAAEPQLLVLDEPESNLDYHNQLTVLDTMEKLAGEGIACVFNTHYPEHALRIAHKSLMLQAGEAVRFGPSAGVVTSETLQAVYGVNTHIATVRENRRSYAAVVCLDKAAR